MTIQMSLNNQDNPTGSKRNYLDLEKHHQAATTDFDLQHHFIGHQAIKDKLREKYDALPRLSFAEMAVSACFLVLLLMWIARDPQVVPGFGVLFRKGFEYWNFP